MCAARRGGCGKGNNCENAGHRFGRDERSTRPASLAIREQRSRLSAWPFERRSPPRHRRRSNEAAGASRTASLKGTRWDVIACEPRSVSPALLAFGAIYALRRAERRSAMATATQTAQVATPGRHDGALASPGVVTAAPVRTLESDRTDPSVYRCECGHALRVFGGGRHRVYFEPGRTRFDDAVLNRVCPACGQTLPGKNRP
jgi:hypothetical protein